MTTSADTATIREVLETALGVSLAGIEHPSRDTVEGWDSLAHLEIVFLLEERFEVRFAEDEIPRLTSVDEIVRALQSPHAP